MIIDFPLCSYFLVFAATSFIWWSQLWHRIELVKNNPKEGQAGMSSPPSSTSSSSNDNINTSTAVTAIVTSIVGGLVAVAVVFLVVRCCMLRMKMKKWKHKASMEARAPASSTRSPTNPSTARNSRVGTEPVEKFLEQIMKEKPIRFSPEDIAEFTQNYGQVLGSGGFGVVYKGHFLNGLPMAVKVLNFTLNTRAEEQFMAEVGTIGRTYHINLVKLYGFCFDPSVKALVYEYMEKGSLDKHLFEKNKELEWAKLHEIAVGTAKGLRYLHEECQPKIVHYDIKPANVLLATNFTPKVADFGLAKFCDPDRSQATLTGARGTPGYAAPEMWMPMAVSLKCDVYSFGMMLFEILARRKNFMLIEGQEPEWFPQWLWQRFEAGDTEAIIEACEIEERDRETAERMYKVALWCVQYRPEDRPLMSRVVRMLEGDEQIAPPTNPYQYLTAMGFTSSTAVTSSATSSGTAKFDRGSSVSPLLEISPA